MKATALRRNLFLFCLATDCMRNPVCNGLANRKQKNRVQSSRGFGNIRYVLDTSPSTVKLLEFLEDEEVEGLDSLDIGFAKNGLRGVFAKESVAKGNYICAVPFVTTFLIDETFTERNEKKEDLLSAHKLEKAVQFLEKMQTQKETWQPYLDCLPTTGDGNFDATPDFWSEDEIRQLEEPTLVEDMLSRKAELETLAAEKGYDLKELQRAAWLVRSRAFTTLKKAASLDPDDPENLTKEGLLQRTVMIPFFDFLNHASVDANSELQVVETKAYEESFYALTATCNIEKGSELRLQYGTGKETSMELFAKYGFLPLDNMQNDFAYWKSAAPVAWSTTLEEDKKRLSQITKGKNSPVDGRSAVQAQILSFRVYTKQVLEKLDKVNS
eukprot:scaffold5281_cov127-Cylindrotheca_fusiformis.AAC.6